MESPCECGIEPPVFISHGVNNKPTGKSLLGRPRRVWEDNIRMDLKEMGVNTSNLVDSVQDSDY